MIRVKLIRRHGAELFLHLLLTNPLTNWAGFKVDPAAAGSRYKLQDQLGPAWRPGVRYRGGWQSSAAVPRLAWWFSLRLTLAVLLADCAPSYQDTNRVRTLPWFCSPGRKTASRRSRTLRLVPVVFHPPEHFDGRVLWELLWSGPKEKLLEIQRRAWRDWLQAQGTPLRFSWVTAAGANRRGALRLTDVWTGSVLVLFLVSFIHSVQISKYLFSD